MGVRVNATIIFMVLLSCMLSCSTVSKSTDTVSSNHYKRGTATSACTKCHVAIDPREKFELTPDQVQQLTISAEDGDKEAAVKLHDYYESIQGDKEKAFYWLKKAAENGDVVSQYNMGFEYLNNAKIRDKEVAYYWFNKAAEQGSISARSEIEKFLSVDEIEDLTRQANAGNADAPYRLYEYYNFIELDRSQALYWLNIAAKNGHQGARTLNRDSNEE